MEHKFHFMILFCMVILIYFCKSAAIEYQSAFEKGQKAWLDFKKATDNTYQ